MMDVFWTIIALSTLPSLLLWVNNNKAGGIGAPFKAISTIVAMLDDIGIAAFVVVIAVAAGAVAGGDAILLFSC